jgi:hypothetical protein
MLMAGDCDGFGIQPSPGIIGSFMENSAITVIMGGCREFSARSGQRF